MKNDFSIETFSQKLLTSCEKVQLKTFEKNEIITTYIVNRNQVCIVLEGCADLMRYDFNGNQTVVEKFNKFDVFGEIFYKINTNNELFALAHKNSEILFFTYDTLLTKCKRNCDFHRTLTSNLSELFLNNIIELNLRIELLTKRTTRSKILSYFDILSKGSLQKTFILPFSYTDLADFLSVDRSAMMREFKLLVDDGFIKKNGSKITLLY